ncbi:MAG: histidine ammonia-lyase, partial [Thermoplasmata archaeon]|nr:histidine ammonia-lyase [Thermoplasmata archaeon]
LIHSHAATIGPPVEEELIRAMMLHRANALATGFSGVRAEVVDTLLAFLNKRLTPVVYSKGSLGASGDLAPLAHVALALIGEGKIMVKGEPKPAIEVLEGEGIEPLVLQPKEGLGLINGTQYMTARGALCLYDSVRILLHAQIASAMSVEVMLASVRSFDHRIMDARPHPGQGRVAKNMLSLLKDSPLVASHRKCGKHQDAYTLRCIPQVYGACSDALEYARGVLELEMNSATDNPLVFVDTGEIISGGNFHGEPIALSLDFAALAVSEIGNFQERTIYRLVDPKLGALPPFLTKEEGLNSGYMMAQYAAAALVNENKVLSHPASVDSISSSAGQEDHVSMGATSANKLRTIVDNTATITAIHLLLASQAMDLSKHSPAPATKAAYDVMRKKIPFIENDEQHIMAETMATARNILDGGEILEAVGGIVNIG